MKSKARTILSLLAPAIFLLLFALPTTAFASLEKATIRVEFADGMTQSERLAFTDEKKSEYNNNGIDGVVVTNEVTIWMVLEADEAIVEPEINDLSEDSRLQRFVVLDRVYPGSSTYGGLDVHAETDPRGEADAAMNASTYERMRMRLRFAEGLSNSEKLDVIDTYFVDFSNDGLGGALIGDEDWKWLSVEIEGREEYVEYWTEKLKDDPAFSEWRILDIFNLGEPTLPELLSHVTTDER